MIHSLGVRRRACSPWHQEISAHCLNMLVSVREEKGALGCWVVVNSVWCRHNCYRRENAPCLQHDLFAPNTNRVMGENRGSKEWVCVWRSQAFDFTWILSSLKGGSEGKWRLYSRITCAIKRQFLNILSGASFDTPTFGSVTMTPTLQKQRQLSAGLILVSTWAREKREEMAWVSWLPETSWELIT